MLQKLKDRFNSRRVALIIALAAVALYVGWRSGGFDGQPAKKPCEAGRQEIKDDKGKVTQVIRTTCGPQKD
jgi:hypothetical protein